MRTNAHEKNFKTVLLNKDWLTDSLREEIMALSPNRGDINVDNLTQDFSVYPDQFQQSCNTTILFIAYLLIINNCILQLTYYLSNGKL